MKKAEKLTRQGVRDLGHNGKHVHRYAPTTFMTRQGRQMSQMQCHCGHVEPESAHEERRRAYVSIYDDPGLGGGDW